VSTVYSRVYRPQARPRSAPGWILRAPYLPRQGFHKSFATKQNEGTTGTTGTTHGKRDDSLSSLQCFQVHSNLLRNTQIVLASEILQRLVIAFGISSNSIGSTWLAEFDQNAERFSSPRSSCPNQSRRIQLTPGQDCRQVPGAKLSQSKWCTHSDVKKRLVRHALYCTSSNSHTFQSQWLNRKLLRSTGYYKMLKWQIPLYRKYSPHVTALCTATSSLSKHAFRTWHELSIILQCRKLSKHCIDGK
jgi:hypothetical protein